jgi:GLPGLI family protein
MEVKVKKVLLVVLFSLCFFQVNAQTAIAILFETQTNLKEDAVKGLPAYIRASALKQLQSIKGESFMTIQGDKVYFEIKPQEKEETNKGIIDANGTEGKVLFAKNLSVSTQYRSVKLIKDYKTNTYTEKTNNKLQTEKLPTVEWKFTNKKKVILGYTCYEAVGQFNNQQLIVYFTKELKAIASPTKLPFVNGVILEYQYGHTYGKAVKVKMNQALIANFL